MALQFTDQNFKAESAKGFVVIDMYADWCGPCKMMAPIFEALAEEMAGRVKMGKMNVDDNTETPQMFGVSSIPTIIFLKDGEEAGRLVGFQSKDALLAKLAEVGVKAA